MTQMLISFCIPTYNRANYLYKTVNHILKYKGDEIEIVVSDNASSDNTEKLLMSITDPRVKYNRNKENFGFDINLLKCVEMARGKFLFFLADDDIIELKEIPWILETIKHNHDITQILGSIGDKRSGQNGIYFKLDDMKLSLGEESLSKLCFIKSYLGGTILKRDILDINQAKKYIGFNYIHQILMVNAMILGNTISTSKILCYIPKNPALITHALMLDGYSKGKKYFHPLSRISQIEYRIKIINDLLKKFPGTYKKLLNRERKYASNPLIELLLNNNINFFKFFPIYLRIRELSNSLRFWINFVYILITQFIYKIMYLGSKIIKWLYKSLKP